MNSIDYIISTLKEWENKFPNIIVRYTFEKDTAYHVITVEPNELYQCNPDYIKAENHLWNAFSERYPNEDILISEPKHSTEMKDTIYPILTDISKQELDKRRIDAYNYLV